MTLCFSQDHRSGSGVCVFVCRSEVKGGAALWVEEGRPRKVVVHEYVLKKREYVCFLEASTPKSLHLTDRLPLCGWSYAMIPAARCYGRVGEWPGAPLLAISGN